MGSDAAAAEQFGPYMVYERLGIGGMATVHRAVERADVEGFERVVALKRLLPHLAEDATFIKSFVREAKLAALLTHVNIGQIYDLGRVGTQYFISMEYIDGCDLRRILRHARSINTPPPVHVTFGVMLQLCDALDYAHSKTDDAGLPLGLVHRDVSPSNLLITTTGHLKVIDFGIAKAQSLQLRTQTGRVKGKLAYMAPEAVVASKELDARSDLWAVGVILHELLTARPLFWSKNEYQTLIKIEHGDVLPPSTFNPACPPELDAIVAKALARDVNERFASAADLRSDLMRVRRDHKLATTERDIAQWLGPQLAAILSQKASSSPQLQPPLPQSTSTPLPLHNDSEDGQRDTPSQGAEESGLAVDPPSSAIRPKPPEDMPPPREEADAVWGTELADHAVVLDEVPDVASGSSPSLPAANSAAPKPNDRPVATDTARAFKHGAELPAGYRQAVRFSTSYRGSAARAAGDPSTASVETPWAARLLGHALVQKAVRHFTKWPWRITLGLAAIAVIAATLTLIATKTHEPASRSERPATHGTIEIVVDPSDAAITIGAMAHTGSPWTVELPAGTYNLVVERNDYEPWRASVDLSLGELQRFRLALRPDNPNAYLSDGEANATLAITTKPSGLEVMVDGQLLEQRSPIAIAIRPGDHVIVVKQAGIERWWQGFRALPASSYEFSPQFSKALP